MYHSRYPNFNYRFDDDDLKRKFEEVIDHIEIVFTNVSMVPMINIDWAIAKSIAGETKKWNEIIMNDIKPVVYAGGEFSKRDGTRSSTENYTKQEVFLKILKSTSHFPTLLKRLAKLKDDYIMIENKTNRDDVWNIVRYSESFV